jgi:hypothetical protein
MPSHSSWGQGPVTGLCPWLPPARFRPGEGAAPHPGSRSKSTKSWVPRCKSGLTATGAHVSRAPKGYTAQNGAASVTLSSSTPSVGGGPRSGRCRDFVCPTDESTRGSVEGHLPPSVAKGLGDRFNRCHYSRGSLTRAPSQNSHEILGQPIRDII